MVVYHNIGAYNAFISAEDDVCKGVVSKVEVYFKVIE
jgi:hypothetical protein